jgi:hypothetical protein
MSRHGARGDSFTGVWNEKASAKLYTFIKEKVGVSRVTRTDGAESDHKYEGNVFAFGSKNIHSEILICEAFGAKPFDPSTQNREMIPFSFRYPKERLNDYPSTICIAENNPERWGICGADGNPLIQIPYLEEYQESESKSAEGAVILAAPRKHDSSAKLVVLAGYSGPGTEAAAEMLLLTFHQFESVDSMPVWGVLSTEWFQKPGRADQRTLTKKRAWIRRPGP